MRRQLLRATLLSSFLIAPIAAAAAQESAAAGDLAQILAMEDRRVFDGPQFTRLSQHPDSIVRVRAAMAMGRIGDHAALNLLVPMLADRDSLVRIETAFALGKLGDRDAVPELAALVARFPAVASGDFVIEVVSALARLGGPDAERALEGILDRHPASGDGSDRATAQVLLEVHRLGRRSALAPRLKDYVRNAHGDWRRNAAYSATRIPRFGDAARALLDIAQDSDALTRSYVARGLTAPVADSAGIPRGTFLSPLRAMVNDPDAQVRINALQALATYADSSLTSLVAGRLVDRDPNVPIRAAQTLGALGGSQAATALAERFPGSTSFGLRRAVLLALAQINGARAMEVGATWRTDNDWRSRAAYVEVLVTGATSAGREQLTAMVADGEPRVVGAALGGLGAVARRGDTTVIAIARTQLASSDVMVRAAAIGVLGRERNPAYLRDLIGAYRRAESDQLNDARLAAVRSLAAIADSAPGSRAEVETALLGGFPRSADYLVRRAVAAAFGEATMRRSWGAVGPVETGRNIDEYRDLARRYILSASAPGLTIETDRGSVVLSLYGADAPLTVDNFLRLADRHFFDNGRWHRVVPNFVAQDGDPRGDGNGGSGTVIRDEINRRRYDRGAVGMALSGPDTGNSQFFITFSPQPHLDGGYTVFGHVVSGWDVLDQIVQGDRIRRIFRS